MKKTAVRKYFNVTGRCVPGKHYMVDMSEKIRAIMQGFVERGEYFVINRPRQYGKTTTLHLLAAALADGYLVIRMSFEGMDEFFASNEAVADGIRLNMLRLINEQMTALQDIWTAPIDAAFPLNDLRHRISDMCAASDTPVVLMIDEVDRASDYGVFAAFLGLLRDMYLERGANASTFQSVILAGVHDVKNLKKKIRSNSEHSYNSPWNIAADFTVDLSFSPSEIATMLEDYEKDHHAGMDITAISERLYFYTNGYPFLVSRLCKTIDEEPLEWSPQGVDDAESRLLLKADTLFDDLIKNIARNPTMEKLLRRILFEGTKVVFDRDNPDIQIGVVYGIIKDGVTPICVSSIVFETRITNYLLSVSETREQAENNTQERALFVKSGNLDMNAVVTRFASFMKSEYRDRDARFIESNARLLFLAFLKPIINGTGHYAVEPQTRGNRRMDVLVFYGHKEYVIELKIWHGEQYEQDGVRQLANYLQSRGQTAGWLVSFCDLQRTPREGRMLAIDGLLINETIIAFRDKL
jgi:hypothetical protein